MPHQPEPTDVVIALGRSGHPDGEAWCRGSADLAGQLARPPPRKRISL